MSNDQPFGSEEQELCDLEDFYREQEALAAQSNDPNVITRETIWVTRERRRVAIKDMADSHLLNTIRVLQASSPHGTTFTTTDERRRQWLNAMCNEAYRRHLELLPFTAKDSPMD